MHGLHCIFSSDLLKSLTQSLHAMVAAAFAFSASIVKAAGVLIQ
jgi:hypothetical protein